MILMTEPVMIAMAVCVEPEFFTTEELIGKKSGIFTFDVESYRNYFLVAFKCFDTGKIAYFESIGDDPIMWEWLSWMFDNFCVVGFNSNNYDIPIVSLALTGRVTVAILKEATHQIIVQQMRLGELIETYDGFKIIRPNHIDLIEVAPLQASLKTYAARLHCRHMQDLPYDPEATLTREQIANVRTYCFNDLGNTELLLRSVSDQLSLRFALSEQYGIDVRSKSDAQIAEAVLVSEVKRINGKAPSRLKIDYSKTYAYNVPEWMQFQTPQLKAVLEKVRTAEFTINENGVLVMPTTLAGAEVKIGNGVYRMGIGGLHSSETRIGHVADENTLLIDRDVTSYYPAIILTLGLYPVHIGPAFLTAYKEIVDRRVKAKKEKDVISAESLKITANGTFGKLGSPYSILYSPDLLIQVTLTGQLGLLMIIEMIELFGIPVVSANTDGVLIKCPAERYKEIECIFKAWEQQTGFVTEETRYKAVFSRDVNNYIAIMADGSKPKSKGAYSNPWDDPKKQIFRLFKNPATLICVDAAIEHIASGKPIEATIRECHEIERFVSVRMVAGGAAKDGRYLGKTVRWYYAKGIVGTINYVTSGNKVALSEGAKPLMTLPDRLPDDINYDWYIEAATGILEDVGFQPKKNEQLRMEIG